MGHGAAFHVLLLNLVVNLLVRVQCIAIAYWSVNAFWSALPLISVAPEQRKNMFACILPLWNLGPLSLLHDSCTRVL